MNGFPKKNLSARHVRLRVRENTILDAVNRLLAARGYDLMTMDEVATEAGIATASLTRHFESKEALAAASMTRLLRRARAVIENLPEALAPIERLKEVARWTIRANMQGETPRLPSVRSAIHHARTAHPPYLGELRRVTATLGGWIEQAQADGTLSAVVPGEIVLYTIFARAWDPVSDFLKMGGAFSDEEIVEYLVVACFQGLVRAPS